MTLTLNLKRPQPDNGVRLLIYVAAALLMLLMLAMTPLAGACLAVAQLALFALAGAHVADLVGGYITTTAEFAAGVGGLLVLAALLLGWWPLVAVPALYLPLVQGVGVVLLLVPHVGPRLLSLIGGR